jgi:hypothetical protein
MIEERGWLFDMAHGGWIHPDVRDDEGAMRPFDSAADVCKYLDLDIEAMTETVKLC